VVDKKDYAELKQMFSLMVDGMEAGHDDMAFEEVTLYLTKFLMKLIDKCNREQAEILNKYN
jgi:hypothetical protein